MKRTVDARGGIDASPRRARQVLDVLCIGNLADDPCAHGEDEGPAWPEETIDSRALCYHHERGYRAALSMNGEVWGGDPAAHVLYASPRTKSRW